MTGAKDITAIQGTTLCGNCEQRVEVERLMAQVASLTAERDSAVREHAATKLLLSNVEYMRDATIHGRQMERERDAARSERDAANRTRESQWKELQAARAELADARAATQAVSVQSVAELTRLREENAALKDNLDGAKRELATVLDNERAVIREAARLEAERNISQDDHAATKAALVKVYAALEAVEKFGDDDSKSWPTSLVKDAHAAVEALRGGK